MAFGSFERQSHGAPMSEINMVPLIDVMLVLLVIFMVTAPLLTHSVKIDLPQASSSVQPTPPEKVEVSIDEAGRLYWNQQVVDRPELKNRLASMAKAQPQPELHLRADKDTRYQVLAEIMADASKLGVTKLGFVSAPERQ